MLNEIITMEERKEIFNNMVKLLRTYDYDFTNEALYKIIDTWAEQKADLIQLFKKHPNYVEGKFMIAFNKDWNREIDAVGSRRFVKWIRDNLETIKANLPEYVNELTAKEAKEYGYSVPESYRSNYPFGFYADFIYVDPDVIAHQFIDDHIAERFNKIDPSMRFQVGQKMSRAINKICTWLGINKLPDYNKEFAKYADSVNPLKIVRHTIISINPIDYLTMSFGNSWASCHTIDKENTRDMPNSYEGQYSSGTISYMLDKVTMVFYTVSASYDGNEFFFQDKINRNMFHYGEDKLIQGRVYPQSNDSNCDNIYKDIREIVQKVIADCLGIPNYWATKKGTEEIRPYVWTQGTHYPDYQYFNNCCISFPKEKESNYTRITIGHAPICISCGHEHEVSENINHCANEHWTCENCGCSIYDEDDVYWVGDSCYCRDCVTYCESCEEYVRDCDCTWVESEDAYICDDCIEEYYEHCDYCGEYHRRSIMTELPNGNYICEDCRDNYYSRCDECDEWYLDEHTHIDEDTGKTYCDDCWEDVCESENEEEE